MSLTDLGEPWGGVPGLVRQEALLRWLLAALALLWASVAARGRTRLAMACGLLFAATAAGFWCLALARPYGLPYDPAATRAAASAALASAWGGVLGVVPEARWAGGPWSRLALLGVPDAWLLGLPNWLPIAVLPAPALLIHGLWRARAASLGAGLWLTCATGELATLRGAGFLPGLWARPGPSLGLLLAAGAVLAAARTRSARLRWPLVALALAGVVLALGGPGAPLASVPASLLATVDHAPWWLLALPSRRRWDAATRALIGAGLLALAAGAAGAPCDPWGASALLRLGLLLGGARTLDAWTPALGRGLRRRLAGHAWSRSAAARDPRGLAAGLIVLLLAPSSAHAWWRPQRLDPVVPGSLVPLSSDLMSAARWARVHTPREAVFVAVGESAAAVPSLAARRVLHAPGLVDVPDVARRARLTYLAAARDDDARGRRNLRRYGVTHLFAARQDLSAWNLDGWPALEARGRWRLRHASGDYRVYERLDREPPPAP